MTSGDKGEHPGGRSGDSTDEPQVGYIRERDREWVGLGMVLLLFFVGFSGLSLSEWTEEAGHAIGIIKYVSRVNIIFVQDVLD